MREKKPKTGEAGSRQLQASACAGCHHLEGQTRPRSPGWQHWDLERHGQPLLQPEPSGLSGGGSRSPEAQAVGPFGSVPLSQPPGHREVSRKAAPCTALGRFCLTETAAERLTRLEPPTLWGQTFPSPSQGSQLLGYSNAELTNTRLNNSVPSRPGPRTTAPSPCGRVCENSFNPQHTGPRGHRAKDQSVSTSGDKPVGDRKLVAITPGDL